MNRFFICKRGISQYVKVLSEGDVICVSRFHGVVKNANCNFKMKKLYGFTYGNKLIENIMNGNLELLNLGRYSFDKNIKTIVDKMYPHLTKEQKMFDLDDSELHLLDKYKKTNKL